MPYWTYQDELTVNGVTHTGLQVVVLTSLRRAHTGPEANYRICKDIIFWPGLKSEISELCQACGRCTQFALQNPKEPMQSFPIPSYSGQLVIPDIGTFNSENYLITADHFSDFIEVNELDRLGSNRYRLRNLVRHIQHWGSCCKFPASQRLSYFLESLVF